jgi:hypothetical protein
MDSKKLPKEAARKAEVIAEQAQPIPAQDAGGKRPIWSRQINRIDCSMWVQGLNGEQRYSIAITRSYLDKRAKSWKRVHYFDRQDLSDVRAVCAEAERHIFDLEGTLPEPGEFDK